MYETIEENGRKTFVFEMPPVNRISVKTENYIKTTGPIYYSKNSHKKTNKRK
jgi:hypothetical protein